MISPEIKTYVDKKKHLYEALLNYIDNTNNIEENYQNLIKIINDEQIGNDKIELDLLLRTISSIASHHYRTPSFFNKIESFLTLFLNQIKQTYSIRRLLKIFLKNKRLILFLITNKVIDIDQSFIKEFDDQIINVKHQDKIEYLMYLFPEIKTVLPANIIQNIQLKIKDDLKTFIEKRNIGENDNYICHLIRNDLIEEFIQFVNQNKLNLSSKIESSFYETNTYLMKRIRPTLIEYAAFFGSVKIFNFLLQNQAQYSNHFWLYVMHSRKEELIHLLEQRNIYPNNDQYKDGFYKANHYAEFNDDNNYGLKKCLVRTFKCHHIELSNYIINNYLHIQNDDNSIDIYRKSMKYYNFHFFPNNITNVNVINWLCKFNYIKIVELILKTTNVKIESTTILKIFFIVN